MLGMNEQQPNLKADWLETVDSSRERHAELHRKMT